MPIGHAANPRSCAQHVHDGGHGRRSHAPQRQWPGLLHSLGYYNPPSAARINRAPNVYRDFLNRSEETAGRQAQRGGFLHGRADRVRRAGG